MIDLNAHAKPYRVEFQGMTGIVWETSVGRARYRAALSLCDAGWLPRANPASIKARRAPEHDARTTAKRGLCYGDTPEYLPA